MITWRFTTRGGKPACADCLAPLQGDSIVHQPGCRPATLAADGYEMQLTIDLAEHKLAHADGSTCRCKGKHDLTVPVNPEEHGLHPNDECVMPDLTAEAVQRLHEEAHPKGTVFAEYCDQPSCREAMSRLP